MGKPTLGICLGLLRSSRRTRTVASVDLPSCQDAPCGSSGRVPRIGWAPVDPGGEEYYFAHSYAAETPAHGPVRGGRGRGRVRQLRRGAVPPEKSGRAGAFSSDASPAPDPVPRRRGRASSRGALPGPPRRRRPGRAGRGYSTPGPTSSSSSTSPRRSRDARRSSGSSAAWPSGWRSRSRWAAASARSGTPEALLEAGADKVSVNSAALARPGLLTALAERLGSQAVVLAVDAAGGRVRSHAGASRRAEPQPSGPARARSAAPARFCSRRSTRTERATATTSS